MNTSPLYDVLIVDDQSDIAHLISDMVHDEGWSARVTLNANDALNELQKKCPTLMVADVWMGYGQTDGLTLLRKSQDMHPGLPVIMISGHGTMDMAIHAVQQGAYDFLEKPFEAEHLMVCMKRAIEMHNLRQENKFLRHAPINAMPFFKGCSTESQKNDRYIEKVAQSDARILIIGAYGTGKTRTAHDIHQKSPRAHMPCLTIKCDNLHHDEIEALFLGVEGGKHGLYEHAYGGTIILENITSLSHACQDRLIQFLHNAFYTQVGNTKKRFLRLDTRILATSSVDLTQAINQEMLKETFWVRLNAISVQLPPLSERRQEIVPFFNHFLQHLAHEMNVACPHLSSEAETALISYAWPGNLHTLKNVAEHVLLLGISHASAIQLKHLPMEIQGILPSSFGNKRIAQLLEYPLKDARNHFERVYLSALLQRYGHNITAVAQHAQMDRSALHRKLKILNLETTSDSQ